MRNWISAKKKKKAETREVSSFGSVVCWREEALVLTCLQGVFKVVLGIELALGTEVPDLAAGDELGDQNPLLLLDADGVPTRGQAVGVTNHEERLVIGNGLWEQLNQLRDA
jgi:hypothetical protein